MDRKEGYLYLELSPGHRRVTYRHDTTLSPPTLLGFHFQLHPYIPTPPGLPGRVFQSLPDTRVSAAFDIERRLTIIITLSPSTLLSSHVRLHRYLHHPNLVSFLRRHQRLQAGFSKLCLTGEWVPLAIDTDYVSTSEGYLSLTRCHLPPC